MRKTPEYHQHIQSVIDEMGVSDPREAIRKKARARLAEFSALFDSPPFDLKALASCFDLLWSDESPAYSEDSEIVPEADGRVSLRVNQERPLTRQRFSIAHEIGHTLFPDYQYSVRCRKANEKRWTEDDFLESLCDVAASEFMFPLPWFQESLDSFCWTGDGLVNLADKYEASREACARRIVELHSEPIAAVYLSWKLKPKEESIVRKNAVQPSLLDELSPVAPTPKLRVDYAIMNEAYRKSSAVHIPRHKSVAEDSPLYAASVKLQPMTGEADLEFSNSQERFSITAAPIYTDENVCGPNGACSVVAILRPVIT